MPTAKVILVNVPKNKKVKLSERMRKQEVDLMLHVMEKEQTINRGKLFQLLGHSGSCK